MTLETAAKEPGLTTASSSERVRVAGVEIDNVTLTEAIERIDALVSRRAPALVVTPNVDHVVRMRRDATYAQLVHAADLVLADGQPLVWASRVRGTPLKARVAGSDLFPELCAHAAERGLRVFFLGGAPGAAEGARQVLMERHPKLCVAGVHCPPMGFERDATASRAALEAVRNAAADIVFVGLGSPKQEFWIRDHMHQYPPAVSIGVGVSFSFVAGQVRRAPQWMQRVGLEWLHRVAQEPRRLWRRYFVDSWGFVAAVVFEPRLTCEDTVLPRVPALSSRAGPIEHSLSQRPSPVGPRPSPESKRFEGVPSEHGQQRPSIKRLAGVAAVWIVGGTAAQHALKLTGSLVLTRLLVPEAFGLMATAGLLMSALEMLSDFGFRQALVQNKRGGEERYINVAWTLRVMRGLGLSILVATFAWPFTQFFPTEDRGTLLALILFASPQPLLRSLANPVEFIWIRKLQQDRLNRLLIYSGLSGLLLNVGLALVFRNVWALAIGGITNELLRLMLTYRMDPHRARWVYDARIASELVRFGRFVFASSILGFFAIRLDAFFVASYLGMGIAGVYAIAVAMVAPVTGIGRQLTGGVLFPALSTRQDDPRVFRKRMSQASLAAITLAGCVSGLGAWLATTVIELLYDPRYSAAGEALRWLVVAAALALAANTLNAPLMARGRPMLGTIATAARLATFLAAVFILARDGGVEAYALSVTWAALAYYTTTAISYMVCLYRDTASKSLASHVER